MTLDQWATNHDAVAIYLHGSRAQGTARHDSDADVAVLLQNEVEDWEERERLAEELATVLADQLEVKASQVEVHFLNAAPPAFQFRAVRDRRLLWESADFRRAHFETRLLSESLDSRHDEEIHQKALWERIREGRFGDRQAFRS